MSSLNLYSAIEASLALKCAGIISPDQLQDAVQAITAEKHQYRCNCALLRAMKGEHTKKDAAKKEADELAKQEIIKSDMFERERTRRAKKEEDITVLAAVIQEAECAKAKKIPTSTGFVDAVQEIEQIKVEQVATEKECAEKAADAAFEAMMGKFFVDGHLISEAAFDVVLYVPIIKTYEQALAFESVDAALQKYVNYSIRKVEYVVGLTGDEVVVISAKENISLAHLFSRQGGIAMRMKHGLKDEGLPEWYGPPNGEQLDVVMRHILDFMD